MSALRLLALLLLGCGGAAGGVAASRPDASEASATVLVPDPGEYGGGDVSRGVPPSLEQRAGGGAPRPQ
jgi:hypothetical protein